MFTHGEKIMSNEVNEMKAYVKEYLVGYGPEVQVIIDTLTDGEVIHLYKQIMKGKYHG